MSTTVAEHRVTSRPVALPASLWSLFVLWVVYIFSFVDRTVLSIVVGPVKQELGFSDTDMGFLMGPAFALCYTLAGIPVARWADVGSRRTIVAMGLTVWSGMTVLSGAARSAALFTASRVGVGVGEAASVAPAHSMISDLFSSRYRGIALGFFQTGATLGIFFGAMVAGYVSQHHGWRWAFYAVGLPGVAWAVVARFAIREPVRGASDGLRDDGQQAPLREVVGELLARRSFRYMVLAAAVMATAGYGVVKWLPSLLIRSYGLTPAEVGPRFGLVAGVCGAFGIFLGGVLNDALKGMDARWTTWLPMLGALLKVPLLAVALLVVEGVDLALGWFALAWIAGTLYVSPVFTLGQTVAPLRARAMASAVVVFTTSLVGASCGPLLTGWLSDLFAAEHGDESVRYALMCVGSLPVLAVLFAALASRHVRHDIRGASSAG